MTAKTLKQEVLNQYRAVREAVGFLDLADRGKIEATGPDRITFLHAMISNDVVELPEWSGRYGTFLTDRGKIVSDFFYYKLPETLLIDVACDLLPVMKETLGRYIIMDEVELEDLTDRMSHFSLQGPGTSDLVEKALGSELSDEPYGVLEVDWKGDPLWLISKPDLAESGCELVVPSSLGDSLREAVLKAGDSLGLVEISQEVRNILRLEAGIPWYGSDMDENRYPMEARLDTAISLTKGCYLGQEVVSKATHIGGVANLLMGLKISEPGVPVRGARVLSHDGTQIGSITSAVFSPRFEHPIALAYLKSKFALAGEVCRVESGEGETATAEIVDKFA